MARKYRLLVRMCGVALCLPILMQFLNVRKLFTVVTPYRVIKPPEENWHEYIRWASRILSRKVPVLKRKKCLVASLLVYRFLLMYGYDAVAMIGCRLVNGQVKSHAWVCLNGQSFTGKPEKSEPFVELLGFSDADMLGRNC